MSVSTIRMTEFYVEKLRCVGSQGNINPYRITVYDGLSLGKVGPVADITLEAANHDKFDELPLTSFKRLLNMFGI